MPKRKDSKFKASITQKVSSAPSSPVASLDSENEPLVIRRLKRRKFLEDTSGPHVDRTLRTQINNQTSKCPEASSTGNKSRTAANANMEVATVHDHILRNFKLRRIVKENHGHDINALSFFFFNLGNYEAPVRVEYIKSYDKANRFDNEHMGDHLDIMSNFALNKKPEDELLTCCWLCRQDDVLPNTIADIQKYPKDDQHLLSASRDGSVRIWHVDDKSCSRLKLWLWLVDYSVSCGCWHPSGETFITGSYHGDIRYWTPPEPPKRHQELILKHVKLYAYRTDRSVIAAGDDAYIW
ncbi:6158_t:CDS:2 [Paraglomus brasilianum]|uniref:6158_t:CDS:1 n=1 Tax=Paraglomus brasilianum TaxID=144538 RepID=A0A9N8ZUJ3_9GLOM|nr:6158_t:CDS:2 [Paraglomus brasilianum]